MRSGYLLLLCVFLFTVNTEAQKRIIFKINPGQKITDVVPQEEAVYYTAFATGNIYFRNEAFSRAPLNYNSLFGEMQFIDPKGDTLSLADENTVKLIAINTDTFFYSKGYLRLIKDYGEIKLANKQSFSFVNRQKIGGFGETSSASIDSYNTVSGSSYFKDLIAKELLTIAKNSEYYIGDKFNNFKVINKKNLIDFFAKNEKDVQLYLKENKVDFSNEEEIKRMLVHLKSIETQ